MYRELINKKAKMALIGLGYVGLPIALEFAKKIPVIGFDLNHERIKLMQKETDPSNEMNSEAFKGCDIKFTSDQNDLREAKCYIVAVPTPIDVHKLPDLKPLLTATDIVGKVLKEGDYVIYESTVYPGCTEEDCVPLLEKNSGLTYIKHFKVGYSPERINPGDKEHALKKIVKVVSGCDESSVKEIAMIYELIIEAGIYKASSIKVAEAAKVIENTQRDINIAFMNELSTIFHKMDLNTYEVLEAASTKWNFLRFYPGLVGGHCIGVDPYYLSYKAKQYGHHAQIINAGRAINDSMGYYIADQVLKKLIPLTRDIQRSRVLVMGVTFKENVTDLRNSKTIDLINELRSFGLNVDIVDPRVSAEEFKYEYGLELKNQPTPPYQAVIVTVNHTEYLELEEDYFSSLGDQNLLLVDVKGIYQKRIKQLNYWSL
jgi:UDP-N-acetyl-D-galactosamine dehydrogenase